MKKTIIKRVFLFAILLFFSYTVIRSLYLYNQDNVYPIDFNPDKYYLDYGYFKEEAAFSLDSNNVTYVDYAKIKSFSAETGISYNPISIGLMGMKYYKKHISEHNPKAKRIFLAHADWFVSNIDNGFWYLTHKKEIYGERLTGRWPSALAQGNGISVLVRAYLLTGSQKYRDVANDALKPFLLTVENGGITSEFEYGKAYEEYPTENPKQVLNGMISSLWGLYDLHYYFDNAEAKDLFDSGIKFLERNMSRYNAGYWTRYSLETPKLSNRYLVVSPWYQKLHAVQLKSLCDITQSKVICLHAEEVKEQESSGYFNFVIYPLYTTYEIMTKLRTLYLKFF
ncbi:D-glucuronyl C5-epimerase family protein [Kangiella sediminilitoris]|uniref:D-glucuronyl C5-epimerase C-terminal domain-containing protein n=1 Tax=Kangiella sediminilitoris TaxID=1144748 RepID=A0A1B3BBJ7_9GAMM|nr:D-glucuronyl C5-epimerase family protein [Kangiella sediminilitoris]AOE50163.1 hypothetical protein KS2013_1451 [Kangiella sediminilitoris]